MANDNPQLDAFLAEGAPQEPAQAPATPTGTGPSGPPESPPAEAKPSAAPAAPAKATEKAAKPEEPDDDAEPPAPRPGEAVIPRHALEDERRKRNDWKQRAVEAETRHQELMRQLEEAKKAPPPRATAATAADAAAARPTAGPSGVCSRLRHPAAADVAERTPQHVRNDAAGEARAGQGRRVCQRVQTARRA